MYGTEVARYKSHIITYSAYDKRFYAYNAEGDEIAQSNSQELVEKALDAHTKQKFTPIKAICISTEEQVTITSRDLSGRAKDSVWVSDGKSHHKASLTGYGKGGTWVPTFAKGTPANLERLKTILDLRIAIKQIDSQIDGIKKEFTDLVTEADIGVTKDG